MGTVVSLQGQVAEVAFSEQDKLPAQYEILVTETKPQAWLEVAVSSGINTFYCFVLTPGIHLTRGMKVKSTGHPLMIPTGDAVLGRAIDIFGRPYDTNQALKPGPRRAVFSPTDRVDFQSAKNTNEVIETGVKAIDFFTPLLRGGKNALIGGAGIGKTVILTELVNRLVVRQKSRAQGKKAVAVFAAVGERSREAQELLAALQEANVMQQTSLLLGQMGESPAIRFRTAFAGATIAQAFRDEQGADVAFFMDNLYRFAQAGYELSTLMKMIPSEDGYQPTLPSEMAALQEKLTSTDQASITSFMAIYVPSDDMTDHAVLSALPYLDTIIILSREVFQSGRFPAIDLLSSTSAALSPIIVGDHHYSAYLKAKNILEKAADLERIVSLIGETELSVENRQYYHRAKLLYAYMSQDLFISQLEADADAAYVPLNETIQVVADILAGNYDKYDPDALRFIGSIANLKRELVRPS